MLFFRGINRSPTEAQSDMKIKLTRFYVSTVHISEKPYKFASVNTFTPVLICTRVIKSLLGLASHPPL